MSEKIEKLKNIIESAFDNRNLLKDVEIRARIEEAIELLDAGLLKVAHAPQVGGNFEEAWLVNEWIKKAILLYFAISESLEMPDPPFSFFDKIPLKKIDKNSGVRVVPGAIIRRGSFIEKGVIAMPSFVNIGAHVGAGTMIDTWATVGSCAQVGKNVHLSGGVGIGGVLEPLQAQPVIVEDNCFVGSRAILVEGVRICEGAVIGANVVITASTKIYDVSTATLQEYTGFIPPRSVVIPGMREKRFPAAKMGVPCALIIGKRSQSTDEKVSLNDALRNFQVSV